MVFKAWMLKLDKFGLKIMDIFLIVMVIQQEKNFLRLLRIAY